jgi:hypothetical protein
MRVCFVAELKANWEASMSRSVARWTLATFACGWLTTAGLAAQVTLSGSEIQVGNSATFQAAPAAASNAVGNVVVAWQRQNSSTGGWDIYARQLNPSGLASAEFQVNTTTGAGCRQFPAVGTASDGSFVVVWQSDQTGQIEVFGRRFDATGHAQSGEFQVNTNASGNRQFPAVAMAPDGRFLVVWQSDGEDGSSWGVFGQAYKNDGTTSGTEFQVNSTTAGAQHSPAVAFVASTLSADLFAVVWQSEGQDGPGAGPSGIFTRSFDGNGNAQSTESAVNLPMTGAHGHPRIASDPSGNFVVAWEDLTSAGSGVYLRRFSSSGTSLSTQLSVDASTAGAQHNPAVTTDAIGNFVVTWDSPRADGSGTAVFAEQFDGHETLQGSKVQVNSSNDPGDQSFAVPAASAGSTLWIVWQGPTSSAAGPVISAVQAKLPFLSFYTVPPCRLIDTRNTNGTFGGPILTSGMARNFPVLSAANCTPAIPATAKSLSLNVTVTGATSGGSLTVYPGDAPVPQTSTVNFSAGQTRANNAVMLLSRNGDGSLEIRSSQTPVGGSAGQVHVIVDVNGYFQ